MLSSECFLSVVPWEQQSLILGMLVEHKLQGTVL